MAENKSDVSENLSDFDKAMKAASTDAEKIKAYYMFGHGSIQDYARIFRMDVPEVLRILDLDDMNEVQTQGDLIDQAEAGPEVNVNPRGNAAQAHYTTD